MDEPDTPVAPGGVRSALDLTTEKDRGMVRKAAARWPKRWGGLSDALKDRFVEDLKLASDAARAVMDDPDKALDAAKVLSSVVKTATVMEGQNQKDDHHEADLAAGKVAVDNSVRILIIDASGNERPVSSVREFYEQAQQPPQRALPAPDGDAAGSVQAQDRQGRPPRG